MKYISLQIPPVRHSMKLAVIFYLLALFLILNLAHATQIVLPTAKEPSFEALLQASEADPKESRALVNTLWRLVRNYPGAVDADLQDIKEGEDLWLREELERRGAIKWGQDRLPAINNDLMNNINIVKELEDKRIHDPGRQIDAISRQLEKIGTATELPLLTLICFQAKTHIGSWRILAAIQGILEREDVQKIVETDDLDIHLIAPLLRDLSSEKAGRLALAFWQRYAVNSKNDPWWIGPSLRTRLWLAWSISEVDPQKALEIFVVGLKCHDSALRLFSGMGILRISSNDTAPFLFTASPEKTKTVRENWLRTLTVNKPKSFRFSDPFALPLIKEQRGSRVDLLWCDDKGSVVKEEKDVWPAVRYVLSDGTFYSVSNLLGGRNFGIALTNPAGETLGRFPGSNGLVSYWPSEIGGLWGSSQNDTSSYSSPSSEKSVEYAPTGEVIWAVSLRARYVGRAGRGTVLSVNGGRVEIVNRRGDMLWNIQGLDDARWACMLDSDTVLICYTNTVEIHSRTKGLLKKIEGFKSLEWVRYHPDRPWVVFDSGAQSMVIYNPKTDKRIDVRIGWTNDDPSYYSTWLSKGQIFRVQAE